MKLNIIGGSGFIGSRLALRLNERGIPFKIIDKVPSLNFPKVCNIANVCAFNELKVAIGKADVLINLAAEHRDDVTPKSLYHEVNVEGAKNICKVAESLGVKSIIFTSSVAVYGFAPPDTNESGVISPYNEYGKTKWEAEQIYQKWQQEDPCNRTLVIIRPTVVFGERNRGNVFNLLRQISSGKFLMVGNGFNRKSMAYVENVAAFLEYSLTFASGIHVYNYIDKPDFTMNALVEQVNKLLGRPHQIKFRIPFSLGLLVGGIFDLVAKCTGKKFSISKIRIKKFCADSIYVSSIEATGFIRPVPLANALERTIRYEFIEDHKAEQVFFSE